MSAKQRLLISLIAGLLALMLASPPMWWGILFSSAADPLVCASLAEDADQGWRWEENDVVLRFKSIDILLSFLRSR